MKFKFLISLLFSSLLFVGGCSDDDPIAPQPDPTPDPQPELPTAMTFKLDVAQITQTSALLSVVPSSEDGLYYADIARKDAFEGLSDEEIIRKVAAEVNSSDLKSGKQQFVEDRLVSSTEYLFYAFGYQGGEPDTALAKLSFTTLKIDDENKPEPQPEPQPQPDPVISLGQTEVACQAEGGVFKFVYTIANATDENLVEVKSQNEWVRIIEENHAVAQQQIEGQVQFEVEANSLAEVREAVIQVAYKDAKPVSLVVRQAAKAEQEPDPEEPPFQKISGKVNDLNAEAFRYFIWDYVAHPEAFTFRGKRPAVVDFGASWCGPCQSLHPILDRTAASYKGMVDFFYVDVDLEPELSNIMQVNYLPSLFFIAMDGSYQHTEGGMSEDNLNDLIYTYLLDSNPDPNPDQGGDDVVVEGPKMVNEFWAGDRNRQNTDLNITAFVRCASQDARTVKIAMFPTQRVEQLLQEMTLETIAASFGMTMKPEEVAQINAEGIYNESSTSPGKEYAYIILAKNERGGATLERCDIKTTGGEPVNPDPEDRCAPELTAMMNSWNDNLSISMQCSTANASFADYLLLPTDQMAKLFVTGQTDQQILDAHPNRQVIDGVLLDYLNNEGLSMQFPGYVYGSHWTLLARASNSKGRTIIRADRQVFAPDAPEVRLYVSATEGNMTCSIQCMTADAQEASFVVAKSSDVDAQMASGLSLEMLMDGNHLEITKLDRNNIDMINATGCVYGSPVALEGGVVYSWIVDMRNGSNRSTERCDCFVPAVTRSRGIMLRGLFL